MARSLWGTYFYNYPRVVSNMGVVTVPSLSGEHGQRDRGSIIMVKYDEP